MDIVTLGAALNGSAEQTKSYVEGHFVAGTNIQIDTNSDGTQTISATGDVSSEDTYARTEIANHIADKANPHEVKGFQVYLTGYEKAASASAVAATDTTNQAIGKIEKALDGKQDNLTIDAAPTDGSTNPVQSGGVYTALSGKVDVESGKGLSANDFTDALKSKLDGIASGAEVNVQSDWNQTTNTADDYIKNKPSLGTAAAADATDFATAAQGTKADSALQGLKVNNSAVSPDSNKIVSITIPTSAVDVSAIPTSAKGANSGVAELDATGKVPASQLPSYVDDVIEGYYYNSKFYEDSAHTTEITGTTGKIYVDLSTNKTYRWSGSGYTEISASLALGTTSSTAYRGDRGATAYTHATDSSRLTTATSSGLYKVASTSQGHIASLAAVQKSDITALGIPAQDTTVGSGIVLTGYEKSSTGGQAVSATDTVNEAIGKIEKRVSDNENNISKDEAALVELVDGGAKNIADMSKSVFTTTQKDGVTVTLSGDSIVSSGNSSTNTNNFFNVYFKSTTDALIPSGTWVAALIGTGIDNFRIEVYDNTKSDMVKGEFGQALEFTIDNGVTGSYVRITNKPSTDCTGSYKLLICTKAAWDISHAYQPYRPSYQELYEMVKALQANQ